MFSTKPICYFSLCIIRLQAKTLIFGNYLDSPGDIDPDSSQIREFVHTLPGGPIGHEMTAVACHISGIAGVTSDCATRPSSSQQGSCRISQQIFWQAVAQSFPKELPAQQVSPGIRPPAGTCGVWGRQGNRIPSRPACLSASVWVSWRNGSPS